LYLTPAAVHPSLQGKTPYSQVLQVRDEELQKYLTSKGLLMSYAKHSLF